MTSRGGLSADKCVCERSDKGHAHRTKPEAAGVRWTSVFVRRRCQPHCHTFLPTKAAHRPDIDPSVSAPRESRVAV